MGNFNNDRCTIIILLQVSKQSIPIILIAQTTSNCRKDFRVKVAKRRMRGKLTLRNTNVFIVMSARLSANFVMKSLLTKQISTDISVFTLASFGTSANFATSASYRRPCSNNTWQLTLKGGNLDVKNVECLS